MAVYIKVSKDDVTLEEVRQVFENPTDKFDIHNFDGTKGDYYEMEVRGFQEGEERKAKKEFLKIVDNLRKQNLQINIGQQFYSKDYDETLQVHSIREQPDPKIYLSGTTSDREVTLYKSDIVRLLNEERLKEVNTPKKSLNTDILNFLNTVKQMETTEQKEARQQPTIDLQIGQKLHYKEDVFEVTRFAKDKNGQDMVILKDPSIGSGIEIPWYRSNLEEVISSGQYQLAKPNNIEQQKNQDVNQSTAQTNEVSIGQKFQFKESNSVLEVVKIDKNAHRDGSDELTMKPIGVNVGNQEFNWSKLALDTAIKEGKVVKITQQQAQSSPQLSEQQSKQLNYLKNQVKYLGLGEDAKLHKDLENAILSPETKVTVRAEYNYPDRLMKDNTATFDLNLTKTEQGSVFLNSYRANLTTKNGEERSQTFKVQKENNITAKEAINLLEGRSVKIEHNVVNKETGELSRTESFIKLNMKEPKTEYGNYKYEWYNKNAYGVDVDNIMQKSNLTFTDDTERERTKKHLEKGNITQVSFQQENRQIQGFAVLNPQWKMLNLYDNAMNRVTIQNQLVKPEVTQSQQKNNVPEHSISR